MSGVLEEILKSLHESAGGKIQIILERFADAIEVRVIKWDGGAPIYTGCIETRATLFEDALNDDLAGSYVIAAACSRVRDACLTRNPGDPTSRSSADPQNESSD